LDESRDAARVKGKGEEILEDWTAELAAAMKGTLYPAGWVVRLMS